MPDAELIRLLHQRYQDLGDSLTRKAAWRLEDMMKALQSIAANTCCGKCQEAANVARDALVPAIEV